MLNGSNDTRTGKTLRTLEKHDEIGLPFVLEDFAKLPVSMRVTSDRIKAVSDSLRTVARADGNGPTFANIHEGLESTVLLLQHRIKAKPDRPAIELVKDYGDLPPIQGDPGQLNQVFMNILANAIDAVEESNRGRSFAEIAAQPNRITITTRVEANHVKVSIADDGIGMPEDVQARIFEYQFTTKPMGSGTGLGLAISHQIVVETHQGQLLCRSAPNSGTEFVIVLPATGEVVTG